MNATPRPINILVVDDNVDAANSLAAVLRFAGHLVNVAWNGEQALSVAKQYPPEIVVMDLGMPYMNGYETARRFREDPALKSASLIALTGWGTDEDRRRTTAAGFAHHFVKPTDPLTILAVVDGSVQQ